MILVAEDNEINQLVVKHTLLNAGYDFKIVADGRQAVESFLADAPALILMDISMPVMNGHEATREIRLREAETGGHVIIIGVTANALQGDCEACLEAGMDDYLAKPLELDVLVDKIANWLARGTDQESLSA
ncbi:MAG: response regulator [Hyphomicrobiales bacterium]